MALLLLSVLAAALFGLPHGSEVIAANRAPSSETITHHPVSISKRPTNISRAVTVYLSPRGQKYFQDHLLDLVARHGFELGEGGFEKWDYQADEPVQLSSLPLNMRPYAATLGDLRDLLKRWITNSDFGDPLINAQVRGIYYATPGISHFGLHLDPEATDRLLNNRGVAFNFRAEFPHIHVEAEQVRSSDINNSFLGSFGVNRPFLDLAQDSQPLSITVPISLKLDKEGGIRFELRGIQTNLTSTKLTLGLQRGDGTPYDPSVLTAKTPNGDPFVLPALGAKVNGVSLPINKQKLETELTSQTPALLKAAQEYLSRFVSDNAPTALNQLINDRYSNSLFSDINEMDPAGIEGDPKPEERYLWGITPEELRATQDGFVVLGFSGFVEDPLSKTPDAKASRIRVAQPAKLSEFINPSTYDAAVAINEDLVNRVIGLSFRRGYKDLRQLDVAGSKPLKVLEPPEFRFDFTGDRGKLHIKVEHFGEGFAESLALDDQVTFQMDVDTHLVHTKSGQLSVVADGVDVDSLSMYTGTVNFPFRGIVFHSLRSKLRETNAELRKKPKVIVEALPIPTQIGGIPIKVKDFRADTNGYLVLFTEYDFSR